MKKLILAEKPSVAKNIADATKASRKNGYYEGDDYIITWAFGHLLSLYDARDYDPSMKTWRMDRFPFIPEEYKYKMKADSKKKDQPDAGVKKQIGIIQNLANREDVEGIISATDDDREGQIIADEIFQFLDVRKPIERILLNEWTENEVNRGLSDLKSNREMQSLQDAGFGRQIADWLIGINLTSVATLKTRVGRDSTLLNVGRVLMPTLKIIYDRDKEIEEFKTSKYYRLKGHFDAEKEEEPREFEGFLRLKEPVSGKGSEHAEEKNSSDKESKDSLEKFDTPELLAKLQPFIDGHPAIVADKSVVQKKEYPPYLFNLSNLQGYITGKYKGWTSDRVLKTAQDLYEKKLITYPRTASQVLDESIIGKTAKVLEIHKKGNPYEDMIRFHTSKRVFDSKKVESHSAIIPTYMVPKNLNEAERTVYDAIKNRFLAQFMPVAVSEDTVLSLKVLNEDHSTIVLPQELCENPDFRDSIFMAKGKISLEPGWKLLLGIDSKEIVLPNASKNDILRLVNTEINEVERKPPKPHTEKSLLKIMETCGRKFDEGKDTEMMMAILSGFSIGTPATRAETIKKLKDAGYIVAKGKNLYCTDLGKRMVETFPVRELFDLEYTGKLEKTLSDIEKKKHTREEFLALITDFVRESVNKIKQAEDFGAGGTEPLHTEPAGLCPECGAPVVENRKAFGCSNWKNGCKYAIWKNDRLITGLGKKVSFEMVKILLAHGKVGFRGCISKKGNMFSAYFYYEKDPKTGKYNWRLEFLDDKKGENQ